MDWIPAISTTTLLAIVAWLARNIIATRLTNSVRHEYDEKIESLKTNLKKSEELFKGELRAKQSQIEALRSGALSGVINRQATLYERQVKAVEELWGAVISLASAKSIASLMTTLKFDVAVKETATNPQIRETFQKIGSSLDIAKLQTTDASKARPFVSPLAWAYYSAYLAIVWHAVVRLKMLEAGIVNDLADTEAVEKLINVALPHQKDYIGRYGPSCFYFLLEELESNILVEMRNVLGGQESDKESISNAAKILKESERLMESNEASNQTLKHG